jgi:hypothetical protein
MGNTPAMPGMGLSGRHRSIHARTHLKLLVTLIINRKFAYIKIKNKEFWVVSSMLGIA